MPRAKYRGVQESRGRLADAIGAADRELVGGAVCADVTQLLSCLDALRRAAADYAIRTTTGSSPSDQALLSVSRRRS